MFGIGDKHATTRMVASATLWNNLTMNTQESTMKNNAVFMSSTEARENCGRRCVEQMGIPERVFVQCLSQGTTSGVVAFAVIVVVVVVVVVAAVVVVVDHVVVVLGARYIANEHETGSSILVILELNQNSRGEGPFCVRVFSSEGCLWQVC